MNLRYYLRGLGIGIIVTAVIMGIISRGKQEPLDNEEIKARAQELGMVESAGVLADLEAQKQEPQEDPDAAQDPEPEAQQPDSPSTEEAEQAPESADADSADGESVAADNSGADNPDGDTAGENNAEEGNIEEGNSSEGNDPEGNSSEGNALKSGEENEQPSPEPVRKETPEPVSGAVSGDETDAESKGSVTIEIVSGEGSFSVCTKLEEAGLIASASSFDRYLYDKGYDRKLRIGTHEIPTDAKPEEIAEIVAFGGR